MSKSGHTDSRKRFCSENSASSSGKTRSRSTGQQTGITIHIENQHCKTTSLNVSLSDTVKDLKNLLQTKIGISTSGLTLVFENQHLSDVTKLETIGVEQWSTLYYTGIYISVEVSNDKTVDLYMSPNISTLDIKSQIMKKGGIMSMGLMFYKGKQLSDECRLSGLGIKSGGVLQCQGAILCIDISVKVSLDKTVPLFVSPKSSILDVKTQIKKKTGVQPLGLMIYKGKQIGDKRQMSELGIKSGDVLHFGIDISVEVSNDKTVPLYVSPNTSILDIKSQIMEKGETQAMGLMIYNYQQLSDECQLSDLGIKSGGVLQCPGAIKYYNQTDYMEVGVRIKRGRDWDVNDRWDGDGLGTVVRELFQTIGYEYWKVGVLWDNGLEGDYMMDPRYGYRLQLA